MKEQYLACGEGEVEIWSLRDDADQSLHFNLLRPHVVIANPRLPIRRSHSRSQDAHGGRLPGAIWTKQPKDLSGSDIERQPIQRHDLTRWLALILTTRDKATTRGERRCRRKDLAKVACANTSQHLIP